MDKAEENEDPEEVRDSVAFSALFDLVRVGKLTEEEADRMRDRYRKMYAEKVALEHKEEEAALKARTLDNEILQDKITLEKVRNEESEEVQKLREMEDEKESIQKQLEYSEQRATMAKYELSELKKIHDDLASSLEKMHTDNLRHIDAFSKYI